MKYSTKRRVRSQLQGHRRRRKEPAPLVEEKNDKLSWTEYKTIRQYQTMGDQLDMLMAYGYEGAMEFQTGNSKDNKHSTSNGYFWLTKDRL